MPRAAAGEAAKPRREKPTGKLARFSDARKNNNDLLADCERLLLRETDEPQMQNGGERRQDVIHVSEMSHSDWCPRSTYLRIMRARAGTLPEVEAHRFQTENIFEEGHEYHRKWQDRFRRMNRLRGRWYCEACTHKWEAISPQYCPECGAPSGAITYHEVGLKSPEHLIFGSADGEVVALNTEADDVLIEVKSVGEGTIRMELPAILQKHTHEVPAPFGNTSKVIDMRGVWKEITKPFKPHLRQGLIYLRLRNDPSIDRIAFIYEFKPTSMVKAFYVTRADDMVDDLFEQAADIVHALDHGGRPPRCVDRSGSCKECKVYEEQESEHDRSTTSTGRAAEGQPARRRRAGEGTPAAAPQAQVGRARVARRPDGPGGRGADGPAGEPDALGGLLGRAARRR